MNEFVGVDFGATHCYTQLYKDGDYIAISTSIENYGLNQRIILPDEYFFKQKIWVPAFSWIKVLFGTDTKNSDFQKQVNDAVKNFLSLFYIEIKKKLNSEVINCVITVPNYYLDRERSGLIFLAKNAGFNAVSLLDENIAGTLGLTLNSNPKNILYYSLGAGPFSCTLLSHDGKNLRALNSGHSTYLSASFLEAIVTQKFLHEINREPQSLSTEMQQKLIQFSLDMKLKLSSQEEATQGITIKSNHGKLGHSEHENINLIFKREEYENNCSTFIQETLDLSMKTIVEAGLTADHIDLIVLAGGNTKIPFVQKMVKEAFKAEVMLADPLAVARGAALYASTLPIPEVRTKPVVQPSKIEPMGVKQQSRPPAPAEKPHIDENVIKWIDFIASDIQEFLQLRDHGDIMLSIVKLETVQDKIDKYIANLFNIAGKKLLDSGRYDEATEVLKRGLELNNNDQVLKRDLIHCFDILLQNAINKKDLKAARFYVKEALALSPDRSDLIKVQKQLRNESTNIKIGLRNIKKYH